jgi:hypothetical protein
MPVMAIRTYEPWTLVSALAGILLVGGVLLILILASRRANS